MKRFLTFLFTFIIVLSCNNSISPLLEKSFTDECNIGDSLYFKMNCCISLDIVIINFSKEKVKIIESEKCTIYKIQHVYKYQFNEFKDIIEYKSRLPRNDTILRYSSEMYCSWKIIDDICEFIK